MLVSLLRVIVVVLVIVDAPTEARTETKKFVYNINGLGAYSFDLSSIATTQDLMTEELFENMKYPELMLCIAIIASMYKKSAVAYKLDVDNLYKGEYSYSYESDDGTIMEDRQGKLDENGDQIVEGSYSFRIGDIQYKVTYYADKNGYHPTYTISKIPVLERTYFSLPSRAVASVLG
ncbi:uncharacterized protein LOC106131602 [Amyelois transitella]|uniref:uncharacterized protein LOC106131602 n=1 Tax=Amyelois transitella TaxID=680683 RepID=UPI00299047D0|nr:uncharacterized protein LOC106131602 [Amyelois transitella]